MIEDYCEESDGSGSSEMSTSSGGSLALNGLSSDSSQVSLRGISLREQVALRRGSSHRDTHVLKFLSRTCSEMSGISLDSVLPTDCAGTSVASRPRNKKLSLDLDPQSSMGPPRAHFDHFATSRSREGSLNDAAQPLTGYISDDGTGTTSSTRRQKPMPRKRASGQPRLPPRPTPRQKPVRRSRRSLEGTEHRPPVPDLTEAAMETRAEDVLALGETADHAAEEWAALPPAVLSFFNGLRRRDNLLRIVSRLGLVVDEVGLDCLCDPVLVSDEDLRCDLGLWGDDLAQFHEKAAEWRTRASRRTFQRGVREVIGAQLFVSLAGAGGDKTSKATNEAIKAKQVAHPRRSSGFSRRRALL